MVKDLKNMEMEKLAWDTEQDAKQSTIAIYQAVRHGVLNFIAWYDNSGKRLKFWGKGFRFFATLLCVCGGAVPVIALLASKDSEKVPIEWGFAFFFLAGSCMLFNQVMGCTSGWIRNALTSRRLTIRLERFQLEWGELASQQAKPTACFPLLVEFVDEINQIVMDETETWAVDFKRDFAQLEKLIQSKTTATTSGKGTNVKQPPPA